MAQIPEHESPLSDPAASPSLGVLLRVWLTLGVQSFGGGTATLFLIRRAVVEQRRWLSPDDFARDWSLCFVAPGINLLGMTILIGWRVAGLAGAIVALLGLMLPSVTITIVMTMLYAMLQSLPAMQAALRGIVPATVGLGLLLAGGMARPLLAASRRERRSSVVVSVGLLLGSIAATAWWQLPVIVVLCGAGTLGAVSMWLRHARDAGPS